MARKYKRKTQQGSWNKNSMRKAIVAVESGVSGYLKASKQYGIPKATLFRRVKQLNKITKGDKKVSIALLGVSLKFFY